MKKILILGLTLILSFLSINTKSQSIQSVTITSPILCYQGNATINVQVNQTSPATAVTVIVGTMSGTLYFPTTISQSAPIVSVNLPALPANTYTIRLVDSVSYFGTLPAFPPQTWGNPSDMSSIYDVATITINQPTELSNTFDGTTSTLSVLCNGDCNAQFSMVSSGGTPPYSFSINGGTFTSNAIYSNLCAGTYNISVTDQNNCLPSFSSLTSITISEPPALTPNGSVTSNYNGEYISCSGAADGEITASISGGTPPYTYSLDGITYGSSTVLSGLAAGTYTIYYIDDNGCDTSESITLYNPPPLSGIISITNQISCFGVCDGELTFQVDNIQTGTPPYTYSINGGAFQNSSVFTGLCGDTTHSITVMDANGCTFTGNKFLSTGGNCIISTVGMTFSPDTVSINLGDTVEFGPLGYHNAVEVDESTWTANDTTYNGGFYFSFGSPGGYFIADSAKTYYYVCQPHVSMGMKGVIIVNLVPTYGCTDSTATNYNPNATIDDGSCIYCNISSSFYSINPTNSTSCDGFAMANVNSTYPIVSYNWTNSSGSTVSSSNLALNLCNDVYIFTVTDSAGCTFVDTLIVGTIYGCTDSLALNYNPLANTDDGSCVPYIYGCTDSTMFNYNPLANTDDGSCIPYIYGCTDSLAYNYQPVWWNYVYDSAWNIIDSIPGQFPNTNNGSCQYCDLSISQLTVIQNSSDSACDGWAFVIANTSNGPVTYSWSSGSTQNNEVGLCSGTYTLTITDAVGCTVDTAFIIGPQLVVSIIGIDVTCFGNNDGSIWANASGGLPPYVYSWNTGDTTEVLGGLTYGIYTVIVTDASGQTQTNSYTITQPDELFANAHWVDMIDCYGYDNGIAHGIAIGGTLPYTFVWDSLTGQMNDTAYNLTPGIHTVFVIDYIGCWATDTVMITEPTELTIAIQDTSTVYSYCTGTNSAQLYAIAFGGIEPYNYVWSDVIGQTTQLADDLMAGIYTVTVLDDRGCSASDTRNIDSVTNSMDATTSVTHVSTFGGNDGSIFVDNVIGAVAINNNPITDPIDPPYIFNWTGPNGYTANQNQINFLYAGNYGVTITDSNNCSITTSTNVNENIPNTCGPITGVYMSDVIHDRATFNWDNMNSQYCQVDQIRFRYRAVGTNSWSLKTMGVPVGSGCNTSNTSKLVLGLTPNTTYEYDFKLWYCNAPTVNWHSGGTFTTEPLCNNVINVTPTPITTTKTEFCWDSVTAYSFVRLKYREDVQGSSFSSIGGFGVFYPTLCKNKNGLTPGIDYRVMWRTWCSATGGPYRSPLWGGPVTWTQPNSIRMDEISTISLLEVYPNPSRDVFNVSFTSDSKQSIEVRVVNLIGEIIFTKNLENFEGEYTHSFNLSEYSKGIYLLELDTDNGIVNKKLILQ